MPPNAQTQDLTITRMRERLDKLKWGCGLINQLKEGRSKDMQATILPRKNKLEDKRKFIRFPIQLSARRLRGGKKEWKGCYIFNVSRDGIGIDFQGEKKLRLGSIMQLEMTHPTKKEPINVMGTLMWAKAYNKHQDFIGGVRFITINPKAKWHMLEYAYDNWYRRGINK